LKKLLMALTLLASPAAATTGLTVQPAMAATTISKLGDLSAMRKIVSDTLTLVQAGKTQDAIKRITDYETAWDQNEAKLRPLDTETWRKLDEASDVALSTVRYASAKPDEMKKDLSDLIALLDNPGL
jgi:predicted phage gp36 major capsid-like protein